MNYFYCFLLYLALIVRWAQDVYRFTEGQLATVELVTDSTFEAAQVSIQAFPRQIPDDNPNRIPSLLVPGLASMGKTCCTEPSLFVYAHLLSDWFCS